MTTAKSSHFVDLGFHCPEDKKHIRIYLLAQYLKRAQGDFLYIQQDQLSFGSTQHLVERLQRGRLHVT